MASISALNTQTPFYGASPGSSLTSSLSALAITTLATTLLPTACEAAEAFPKCRNRIPATPNCYTPNCPDLAELSLHPREKQAMEVIGYQRSGYFSSPTFKEMQEYFRFRSDEEGKQRVLWLVGADSFNDALNPKHITSVLTSISKENDLKYKVIDSFETLCEEVKLGAEMGSLTDVVINTHGDFQALYLLDVRNEGKIHNRLNFKKCFQSLPANAKITILSGAGIQNPNNHKELGNLAQKIANASNRKIVAARANVGLNRLKIDILNPLQMKYLAATSEEDIFKTFYPRCDTETPSPLRNPNCMCPPCQDLDLKQIDPRETLAAHVIRGSPLTKQQMQQCLRLDRDDPRKKILYLVAKDDHNDALHPLHGRKHLPELDKHFDLKYKIISSNKEICEEVAEAAKVGKLAHVIIHAHGSPEGMSIAPGEEFLRDNIDLARCFSGLEPSGRIVLHSCSTGVREAVEDGSCSSEFIPPRTVLVNTCSTKAYYGNMLNLAQTVADQAKRTTIAANEILITHDAFLVSTDPLMFYQTPISPETKIFDTGRIDNNHVGQNIFRTFHPKFSNCTDVQPDQLHDREKAALDAMNDYLRDQSLEVFTPKWEVSQDYFRVCKEDPKPKFLFFTAAYSPNGYKSNPKLNPKFLIDLNDKYDFQYKVVTNKEDVCKAIYDAGKVAGVAIQAAAIDGNLILWKKEQEKTANLEDGTQFKYDLVLEEKISPEDTDLQGFVA